jgi:K+-sensing histidine kinase KdpD
MPKIARPLTAIEIGRLKPSTGDDGIPAPKLHMVGTVSGLGASPANNWMDQALGDAPLCCSMLNNLLKNACEAASAGGQVTVTLRSRDALTIAIENTGAVPEDMRPRFFDKFVASGKADGLGLGIYSSKLLARAQNGDIALKVSDAHNRTTVTVTLPNH